MGRKKDEERYNENVRKQRRELEEFAETETEWAGYLIKLYGIRKAEIPDDEYRACAFFRNREYMTKPGSLTLLLQACMKCRRELPEYTKETGFDLLRYRFRVYAAALEKGGY